MFKTVRPWLMVAVLTGCAADSEEASEVASAQLSAHEPGSRIVCRVLRELCMATSRPEPVSCGAYSKHCEVSLGAVGDSVSDEYQGHSNLPGLNWFEQLASELDVGVHEADPMQRGEPRLDGYSYNWARYGQALLDPQWTALLPPGTVLPGIPPGNVLLQGLQGFQTQLDGLGAQVAAGQVDLAVIWLGISDIRIRRVMGASMSGADYDAFVARLASSVADAIASLRGRGGVKIVVGLPYDADPTLADPVAQAGRAIRAAAEARGAAVIDVQNELAMRAAASALALQGFSIYATAASLQELSPSALGPCMAIEDVEQCATPAYQAHLLNYDGTHFSTVPSGMVANAVVRAVNDRFGFRLPLLSDAAILAQAGVSR